MVSSSRAVAAIFFFDDLLTRPFMAKQKYPKPQNPLILRFHRLMDAFAKSDDERDFYLDRVEGFILFSDLNKNNEEIEKLEAEFQANPERYCLVPKMTFYETKKFMEGFVNEKVYDIDTKEKLLDIIQSKEARENFLEFIYDHLAELEKWQLYYHERSRVRIIEWLRGVEFQFVFEEDLDIAKPVLEKVKHYLFQATKLPKDVQAARETIETKSKVYYSDAALNPRPKRGRPPKQAVKTEVEPQYTVDIYTTVPQAAKPFLYRPDFTSTSVTFSAKFDTEAQLLASLASLRGSRRVKIDSKLEVLSQKLESLRYLTDQLRISGTLDVKEEQELFDLGMTRRVQSGAKEPGEKKTKVEAIAKGLLPKKRGTRSLKKALPELLKEKQEAGIKQVSVIKKSFTKKTKKRKK